MGRERKVMVAVGRRFPGRMVIEQTDYTLKTATDERALIRSFGITEDIIGKVTQLRATIAAALGDRTLASADSQAATAAQGDVVATGKTWLRQAILIGQNSYDGDSEQTDEFNKGPKIGSSVPRLNAKVEAVLGLLKREPARVAGFGADAAFVKRGRDILANLKTADAEQETKIEKLPKATQEYQVNKATLYFLLKQINRAGWAAHVDDPISAGKYNLSILHRRGHKSDGKGDQPPDQKK